MLDSITNLEERALKELEIQRQSAIDEVANYENKEALIYEINKKYDRKEAVLQKKATDAKKKMDQLEMKGS